ncbi:MAG: GNAT family N-acetyltransferase [Thermoplasmata archaeon]
MEGAAGSVGRGGTGSLPPVPAFRIAGLDTADLSPWFNPFLPHFVRETLRCGGEVWCAHDAAGLTGLLLHDPAANITSVFTRDRSLAEERVRNRGGRPAYSDFRFGGPSETYGIYTGNLERPLPAHPFHHTVRPIRGEDLAAVAELMREVEGNVDDRWFRGVQGGAEAGFLIEVGPRLAGVGWVAVVADHARMHSLAVRPMYRHLGLGTDLLFARLLWARAAGARSVLSEIADQNLPSRAVAEAGGMRRVGEIFFYPPSEPRSGP